MNIEELTELAVDYKLMMLKGRENGIANYVKEVKLGNETLVEESFLICKEDVFLELIKGRNFTIKRFEQGMYDYGVKVDGLKFRYITDKLIGEV